ncbi:YkvI family membrane protein [Croceicoccus naphthovorans]|uniref:Membrane protein n=1 Tax=Croceicoccus naphthovorans TaxID=1348774 RepID=A0A0G3XJV0_9SPHN|nr:membrane protein [Croceicoccus naphthovorans]AKM10891.1 membrane protein [Croceicoccus naphthovorans]MBB3989127.1 putative membrane protein YkvI [Croceicoccus naphthovorans]
MSEAATPGFFQRIVLPGLAFKAVVIGGGYATGREVVEFFFASGPIGGLLGLALAMVIWSLVCCVTFVFARQVSADDYRDVFAALLGKGWIAFEVVYILFMILVLAVMGAAAGEIGAALFGWPAWVGTAILAALIIAITGFGTAAAEKLFRYSSALIYGTYAVFFVLAIAAFGGGIGNALDSAPVGDGWVTGGITYASYNVIGAVLVLPFLRHQRSRRDAVQAGLLAGPLAMLPALLFYLCMIAFYPEIGSVALPSDFLLGRLGLPWFALLFQAMIFTALLETGIGMVNALDERAAAVARHRGTPMTPLARIALSAAVVIGSATLAGRFGLIDLIASGYGAFGWIMLIILVVPMLTLGTYRILKRPVEA